MWDLKKQQITNEQKNWAHGYREQIGGCLREGVGKTGKESQKVQISSYKMNKPWGYNV